ncbi:MAG TPA: PEP-CTERM sorting domain-containing protein [Tepidisphaeraceae bacterium]|nr:PEP-CTERM sorting domain-containing protein [Tepidisphaeraceae bacterium]
MRKKLVRSSLVAAACVAAGITVGARGGVVVDGTINGAEGYGGPIATQTVNTGFGDSTVGDGTSGGGSELDAAYGVVQNGNLYVFLSGNVEDNGNHVNLFISDGRAGQSTLSVPATGTLQAMNGSVFSPGFQATYAMDINDYLETDYVEEYTYSGPGALSGGYIGSIPVAGGIGTGTPGIATIGWNDTNAAGVNGNAGTAADPVAADAVTTGMEVAIPLSALGNPANGTSILVLADINGGGDTYLSNQFLPGLPVGTGNLGTQTFNFGGTPGEYFAITVPEPASIAVLGGAVLMLFSRRRRM